ncbi:MAG: DUF5654 family protein [Candidatus Norongarragalinales archaeon]
MKKRQRKASYEKLKQANKALRSEIRAVNKELLRSQLALAQEFQREFRKQLATLVTAAFGFVAALFWNTAIKDTITAFIPPAQTWVGEIIIAVFVTIIAVFVIWLVSRGTGEKKELPTPSPPKPQTL